MNRIVYFDNARALSVLWIVGFWHMIGYWTPEYKLSPQADGICQIITWVALSAFTYFSGFFLGNKQIDSMCDVFSFYKKRLKRFYFLYFLSAATLYVSGIILQSQGHGQLWYPENVDFIFSIFGLSTYIGNPPATLWYFCMLISFYVVTPYINYQKNKVAKFSLCFILFVIMIILSVFYGSDKRNCLYFPFYVLGLYQFFNKPVGNKIHIISLILFVFLCVVQYNGIFENPLIIIFESFLGVDLILLISKFAERNKLITRMLSFISMASMAAYLFHRQICGVLKLVIPSDSVTPLLTTIVYVPMVFVFGLFIQKFYNKIINKSI